MICHKLTNLLRNRDVAVVTNQENIYQHFFAKLPHFFAIKIISHGIKILIFLNYQML